jgi:TetR/AcrR family transcriptional regulator
MAEELGRKERERQQHREEIIEAAVTVFAEKGFHRTTVEDIATEAEFSVGTLYNFFKSKEELYQSMIEFRFQQMSDEVMVSLDQATDPIDFLRKYIQMRIDLCYKYEAFVKLYTRERMGDRFASTELWKAKVEAIYEQFRTRLAANFQQGIEQGCFRDDIAPTDMVSALEGLADGFMFDWMAYPESFAYSEKSGIMFELFLGGVRSQSCK